MVDRCVCFSRTFDELKRIAESEDVRDLPTLQSRVDFGQKCGLCKPYVERMLDTGNTRFPIMARRRPEE
ncbi:(2Fe-2S)-binding protein [bacterium]|nr:(2Fe-2S)-binding protein [bacterium]